jgi:hypothetical protein
VINDPIERPNVVTIALDKAFQSRPVNTEIYTPFLIARLMEHPARVENTLDYQVSMQDVGSPGTRTVAVRWTWTEAMIPPTPLAAQSEYITEAAAYAMAFVIVARFTSARLLDTAQRGERFDHVLSENGVLCGIEISGSQTEEKQALRDRHGQKTRQLLENPLKWGGYVAIVGFTRREVILSYHNGEENIQP